jgi:hypothetical protein
LPWSRWHWRVVVALGIAWMLDGFEVTLVGAIGGVLRDREALGLTESQVGSAHLAGAVAPAPPREPPLLLLHGRVDGARRVVAR